MRVVRIRWGRVGLLLLGGGTVAMALQLSAVTAERDAAQAEVAVWRARAEEHAQAAPQDEARGHPGCAGCTAFLTDHELDSGATGWVVDGGPPVFGGASGYLDVGFHDVQDLVPASGDGPVAHEGPIPPDALVAVVRALSAPKSEWELPASLELHRGQLVVLQSPEAHARVRAVLRELRRLSVRSAPR